MIASITCSHVHMGPRLVLRPEKTLQTYHLTKQQHIKGKSALWIPRKPAILILYAHKNYPSQFPKIISKKKLEQKP